MRTHLMQQLAYSYFMPLIIVSCSELELPSRVFLMYYTSYQQLQLELFYRLCLMEGTCQESSTGQTCFLSFQNVRKPDKMVKFWSLTYMLVKCISSQLISTHVSCLKHSDTQHTMANISGGKKRKSHFPQKMQFSCLILVLPKWFFSE